MIKLSAGTASLCGLKNIFADVLPTTAYLMDGEKCLNHCAFCPQAVSNSGETHRLSRVTWPDFELQELAKGLSKGEENGLKRVCIQTVKDQNGVDKTHKTLSHIKKMTELPVCVSANISSISEVQELIKAGADKIGISLDVCDPQLFSDLKGGVFLERLALIKSAAQLYPGAISTHIMVGLGETDEQIVNLMDDLNQRGVIIGLFAFTPVKGTPMAHCSQPSIVRYRGIQAAHYMLTQGYINRDNIFFDEAQALRGFSLSDHELRTLLQDGLAFQTTGCPDCNRPYYNESPRGPLYNYPRPLTPDEIVEAIELITHKIVLKNEDE